MTVKDLNHAKINIVNTLYFIGPPTVAGRVL